MHIDEFNSLDTAPAREAVALWAAIPAWVDAVVARRPYASVRDLADAAAGLSSSWGRAELDAALAHHPRIGERPAGTGAEAAASRREQASMSDAAADVADRIAAGNRDYEERFGRVFLIRAAGRSPQEMLAELERRLGNDDDAEVAEAVGQLAEIALLRLRRSVTAG
ncbi:2-oxo-4-hydroxy-4-carboxy-5-ureidoimidazoline decarboxylase [Microbacterium sp. Marseille-Q6648]|uniref:2-oxo-4-hydroxy-4-carboxy-5-ureidoimidazoline decarboxylase n=1 Tax=Microbacterium sp. Marseille-Q6648 TaxID=2937991 RepID=UPI00203C43A8|nr:2-oxo-4-hydroxy-4-carboxy-5-ureidoimidazoline decarboxylase [Microbacterium sp. Marseille-Q6648]